MLDKEDNESIVSYAKDGTKVQSVVTSLTKNGCLLEFSFSNSKFSLNFSNLKILLEDDKGQEKERKTGIDCNYCSFNKI